MEAGTFLLHSAITWRPKSPVSPPPSRHFPSFRRPVKASSNSRFKGPKPRKEWIADWVSENDDSVRSLPIYAGGASLLAVLVNRAVSGIAPVADASSSQSRADLLTLGLAVTNILAGLVWLTIRPRPVSMVTPQAISPDNAEAMPVDAAKLIQGTLYRGVMKSGAQNYLANLSLYPGRSELPFLPSNTQAVILQPLGEKGVLIIGGDMIRGFTNSDQAWITLIGEKLDATLAKFSVSIPLAVQDRV